MDGVCKNCGVEIVGVYCHDCGEKLLVPEDFHVSRYIGGFFSSLTNVNSKFYRTAKGFLTQPGKLSADYLSGLRKPFLSPIQIFIIVTVLFFVFAPDFDLFYVPAKWFFSNMGADAGFVGQLAMDKMAELGLSHAELSLKYDVTVKNYAKAFLFLAIPVLAFGSYLSRPKAVPQFGKHMIFATYNLSFFILWFFALLSIAFKLPTEWTPDWFMTPLGLCGACLYFILANRRSWADSWPRAVFSGVWQLFVLIAFLMAYRSGISIAALFSL